MGTVLGPLAAIVLLGGFDWRVVAAAFAVPATVGVLVAFAIDEGGGAGGTSVEADGGVSSFGEFVDATARLFTGGFVAVFVVVMLYGLYYRGVLTFLPEILAGLPTFDAVAAFGRTVSPGRYLYAGLLLVGVVGQYAGGRVSDAVDTDRALAVTFGALVVAAGTFVPASEAGVVPLLVVCGLLGFFVYAAAPIYQATIAEHVASETHGLSYGFTYLGMFGVGAAGAGAAGGLLTHAGVAALFGGLVVLAGLATVLSVVILARP